MTLGSISPASSPLFPREGTHGVATRLDETFEKQETAAATLSPLAPPSFAQMPRQLAVDQMLEAIGKIRAAFPDSGVNSSVEVMLLQGGRCRIYNDHLDIEIEGLDRLARRFQELMREKELAEEAIQKNLEKQCKVDNAETCISMLSLGFQAMAALGLIASGNVIIGGVIGIGFLASAVHQVAIRLNWYEQAALSLGGTDAEASLMASRIQTGIGLALFAYGIGTTFAGGSAAISAGWEGITSSSPLQQGLANLAVGAQGICSLAQAKFKGDKGELDAHFLGVQMNIAVTRFKREDKQLGADCLLKVVEQLFGDAAAQAHVMRKMDEAVTGILDSITAE